MVGVHFCSCAIAGGVNNPGLVPGTGTNTGTGSNTKPGGNLQNVIRNNPISKAINNTLDHIKDSLHKPTTDGADTGNTAGAGADSSGTGTG
jgi:hypothetical protein